MKNQTSPSSLSFSRFVQNMEADHQCNTILYDFRQTHAINVNLFIFLLWFGLAQYGRLAKKDLNTLMSVVSHWHERVLLPLRRVATLSGAVTAVSLIKECVQHELQFANQLEQQFLAEALPMKSRMRSTQQQLGDACHNLSFYFKQLKIQLDGKSKEQCLYLLQFVFPTMKDTLIKKSCDQALQALASGIESGAQLSLNHL